MKFISLHVCIAGFRQHNNQPTGMLNLAEKLMTDFYINGHSRVWLHPWNSNWAEIAELAWLVSDQKEQPVLVNIYAYSWGAGWGAIQFAKELYKRGIRVRTIVLADPVYRHPWLILRWTSLLKRRYIFFGGPTIKIPENVCEAFSFFQRQNRPCGHRLIADGHTIIHPAIELHRIHQKMDDAYEFHELCIRKSTELVSLNHCSSFDPKNTFTCQSQEDCNCPVRADLHAHGLKCPGE